MTLLLTHPVILLVPLIPAQVGIKFLPTRPVIPAQVGIKFLLTHPVIPAQAGIQEDWSLAQHGIYNRKWIAALRSQ